MDDDEEEDEGIYAKNSAQLILKPSFLKRFISVMKLMNPILSSEATDILADEYSKPREIESDRGIDRPMP